MELTAVTYNVRHAILDDGPGWDARRAGVARRLRAADADIVALQECDGHQRAALAEALPDYEWCGESPASEVGNPNPIGCGPDWTVDRAETVWLSESGDPGTVGWDAAYPRVLTAAVVNHRATGRSVAVYNTHFDHVGREARRESARVLRSMVDDIPGGWPAVLLGDFNTEPGRPAYERLVGDRGGRTVADARAVASESTGPDTTLTDFESLRDGRRVDHVFVTAEWTVSRHEVDATRTDERYPSDHLPVRVEVSLS
jgi:endonuclease/exonuclease/phosphatase family metal-dependent hydrolase